MKTQRDFFIEMLKTLTNRTYFWRRVSSRLRKISRWISPSRIIPRWGNLSLYYFSSFWRRFSPPENSSDFLEILLREVHHPLKNRNFVGNAIFRKFFISSVPMKIRLGGPSTLARTSGSCREKSVLWIDRAPIKAIFCVRLTLLEIFHRLDEGNGKKYDKDNNPESKVIVSDFECWFLLLLHFDVC